ncbi:hypothetical protein CCR94_11625 [Rhodoblastus sphagnicola]|uniref:YhaN AAA domain-containing protein n=1 Tax=Rhodoblastus sphagnicola TaxID=333368 RepID=A0A2S6N7W8_9HYPH|nr:YhaN family protein [Rhodoblastus sphagnicola]MBB4197827.1 uncharacterized protein YhaN [Rhodoblastus sphagnicola]PPQ30710.1 hypothetical protein CCR94_11625 [Rhodoblastus sphagnicola]
MRLLDLALEAYGPFAGAKLQFDRAARLHIVHGPNEAGKSSALAAIGDLFYGVPSRAEKTFLRPADLRIGATVEARNGQMLQFFRRRGVKATLLDASGAALPDDGLAPFLGAASRDIFHRAFGLDADNLRRGGDEMLRAEGEIGASLFAAASGLRGLIDLRKGIEGEADEIFGERKASHRTFYQAQARFDDASKAEKDTRLSETVLKSLRRQIEEAEATLADIKARERADEAESIRLNRLLRAAPILKNLERLRASFAAFDDLSAYAPDWAAKLEILLGARREAREGAARAAQARDEAREEADKFCVDADVIANGETIESLQLELGAIGKALDDLPRREEALREANDELRLRALTCGLNDGAELRAALPDAAVLARAERLIAAGRDLLARKIEPLAALEREEKALANLRARQGVAPPDTRALAEKLAAFGNVEKDEESRAELSLACADEARKLDERRARLSPALPDLDRFAAAPSPDASAIELAGQEFDALATQQSEARRRRDEARARLKAAEVSAKALETAGPLVSRAQLAELRARRDALWADLLSARSDQTFWAAASEQFVAAQAQADSAADALFDNATRVVEMEAARETREAARVDLAEAEDSAKNLAEQAARFDARWTQSWSASGVVPAAPRAMARWRAEADNLLAAREALKQRQALLSSVEGRLGAVAPGLEQLAAETGLAPLQLDAGALARRIAARLKELARAEADARELSAKIASAPERIAPLKATLAELADKDSLWRADFVAALAQLRLDADATLDEAQARIALWRDLPGTLKKEEIESRRVATINENLGAFEQKLDALLALCGRGLPARPAVEVARVLHKRLVAERERASARNHAQELLVKAERALAAAAQANADADAGLADFCAAAGFDGDPAALCERLLLRRAQTDAIEAELARLAPVAEGMDEADLAAQARDFDADAARLRLSEISRAREDRDKLRDAALLAQHDASKQLQAHDDSTGAEQAGFDREAAKAEMAREARRWAVLKIASLMVGAGLERHRQRRQDPLLARAGAIYATLTSGRYEGLKQDFAEDDKLHLLALRRDGAALPLTALSEGARDQLYLALRLAFLEDYAQKSEAPPFIGDDLFASFDDARVAAGLKTLAALSPALQPILFTHHDHVVEIAARALGDQVQVLRLDLPQQNAGAARDFHLV